MAEIRGEKVRFYKKDLIPLHELPSAKAHDPLIVHCPPPRSGWGGFFRICVVFVLLVLMALGGAFFAVESGTFDRTLTQRAQGALNDAIGPRYQAQVGSTAIRFDSSFRLAIEARDVDVVEVATNAHLSRTGALRLAIDPLALVSGRISIRHIEAEEINLDTSLLPASEPMDLSRTRIDGIPAVMEQAFQRLDEARGLIERTGTGSVTIAGITIKFPPDQAGRISTLAIGSLDLTRTQEGQMAVSGKLEFDGKPATLRIDANSVNGVTKTLKAHVAGLDLTPVLLQHMEDGSPREGVEGPVDLDLFSARDTDTTDPEFRADVSHAKGSVYFDGIRQEFTSGNVHLAYDFVKNSIEIRKSELRFGPTILPVSGALIDLDRLNAAEKRPGYGLDLLISGATAHSPTGGEAPVAFDLKAGGRFLTADRRLELDDMLVSSPAGQMAGSLKIRFAGKVSPEISFGAQLPRMEVRAVKQLWPYWMAHKPRDWVTANMFGGTITNGSISVFIPAGRMHGPGVPIELNDNELRISFDIADNRLNLPGNIPPVRELGGHFDLRGEHLEVRIDNAASYFPSGRKVAIEGGRFAITSAYVKPLMADLALKINGSADALAELSNFKPFEALKKTEFQPGDFSGTGKADLTARFGLISDQHPPATTYQAHIALSDVALARPIKGRKGSGLNGTLDVDMQTLRISAKGQVDGIPAELKMVEPLTNDSPAERSRVLNATLNNEQRQKIIPGLTDLIDGQMGAELDWIDDDNFDVTLDLTKSALSLPWVGWTKGNGIEAKAEFRVSTKDGRTDLHDFTLKGDGFGAQGDLTIAQDSLSSADFSHVKLSAGDDFALTMKRNKAVYDISVAGQSADLRPVLDKLKASNSATPSKTSKKSTTEGVTVRVKLDRLLGFNDEAISNAKATVVFRNDDIQTLEFVGVTNSGQAVVAKTTTGATVDTITLTSGDAGSVTRFTNLYSHMRGGLLNLSLDNEAGNDWSGSLDIRNFNIVDESRLQSIVSTPVGEDGRSLNSAVKKDIDVSSAKFQRGFARLVYRKGALSVDNGVVRGEQIGATFQGMMRDAAGNMDMTGTFMPAYGLNRLFAELPIIGSILGNGRDRGLLGITFKLTGKFDQPKLTINPLSIIAPGVFRQIFEFQ